MDGGFFFGRRRSSLLFRQFDYAAGHALQLPDVLTALADDSANLSTGHENLDGKSNVLRTCDVSLLPHLFEDQILSLKLQFSMLHEAKECQIILSFVSRSADRK